MIKTVILDDEPKAIEALSWELANFKTEVEIVATFTSPEKALTYLNGNKINCLFLDIEMPTMDGFQFLEKIKTINFAVIITTAYSEYAITALKNGAIDYLLKPIDADDLKETIQRIKKDALKEINNDKFKNIFQKLDENLNRKIKLNVSGKLIFIESKSILYVKSDGNYSTFYLENQEKIVITKKLKEVTSLLPENDFFRIHNSYLINLKKITAFLKVENLVILENTIKIPVSRQRKSEFLKKI